MDKITKKLIEIETKLDLILKMVKARNEKTIEDSQNQISNIPIGEVIGKKPIRKKVNKKDNE
jgi:uncharacterized protein YqgV (UPF0045/DUF77 family)